MRVSFAALTLALAGCAPPPDPPHPAPGAPPVRPSGRPPAVAGRDAVRLGDVEVAVTGVARGEPAYVMRGRAEPVAGLDCLAVRLRLRNLAWSGAAVYRGWAPRLRFGKVEDGPHPATLTAGGAPLESVHTADDSGGRAKALRLEGSLRVPAAIRAGEEAGDVLLFAPPEGVAGELILTLPGKALGAPGEARFSIPKEMIRREK